MGSACGAEAQVQPHSPVRALSEELAALTREVAGLRSLEFEANDPKSWQQTATVQDFVQNPLLTQLRKGGPSLGDPSILEVSGCYHLFVPCSQGILHLSSQDGLSNWNTSELAVNVPGAVGPFVRLLEGVVHLFYEQRGESAFQPASIFLKTAPVLEGSKAWQWSKPRQVLEPQLEWEKVGKSRVGNPFVVFDEKAVRWLLYYSASLTFLTDARIDDPQPLFIGLAEAPAAEGPYRRLQETPLFRTASDVHPQIIGAGSFKIIQGFDTLSRRDSSYDALDHGSPRKLLALQSRLTRTALGITGSSFALLASEDGLSWDVLDAHFLMPVQRPGWNIDYMLSFDTLMPSSDANHVFLYYHAREGQPGSSGCVGVARIQRSFLEELSCSQATRVRA